MSEQPAESFRRVGIVGAGAWGTALAQTATDAGSEVLIRSRSSACADAINIGHGNPDYLPGIALDTSIRATTDLVELTQWAQAILLVTPAQAVRETATALAPRLKPGTPIVICSKGLEQPDGILLSAVLASALPQARLAVLSGPNFAAEIARRLPAATTLACTDPQLGQALAHMVSTANFRPYFSTDIIGAQIGGAVKNVIAIACGICDGRRYGENARAALLTRGLAEITRLAVALGGEAPTLRGLSGLGDLSLTCASTASRNYALGQSLGSGTALSTIMAGRRTVAEGVYTAAAVVTVAAKHGVEVPICAAVSNVLNDDLDLDAAIGALLTRPLRREV
ncbi:MAG: NAD(P)H-dependent glycerol-3-phosphate dehydrogenase [Alphaproteobacteria bacterium]